MDYLDFGDNIDYNKYNALVYLLRKFKKLTSNLTLGAYKLESDYGTFNFSDGFVNVGNNWILENPVTVTSNDVLKNTFYTFNFVVIDVNTTGTVNRRIVSVTAGTGETGTLELTIPSDLIGTDEVILPNFTLEVVFNEHEYYTPLPDVHVDLSVDKLYVGAGETVTVTGVVTDGSGSPLINVSLSLNVNGTNVSVTTDTMGVFSYSYTGTGRGWVVVSCNRSSVTFYDGVVVATVTGTNISFGGGTLQWLESVGDVIVDWGDGSTDTVNNPTTPLTHSYTDGEQSHNIKFRGEVTSIGYRCFYGLTGLTSIWIPNTVTSLGINSFSDTGLTSITIPNSVINIGASCFVRCRSLSSIIIPPSVTSLGTGSFSTCTGLNSVVIPDSVTSLGSGCFRYCSNLVDYQLYWSGDNVITYDSDKMPNNTNTIFTVPVGTIDNYISKGYPSNKLVERGTHTYSLSIASDKQSILTTESVAITGTLLMDSSPYTGQSIALYDGSTLIDTLATDSNGNYSKTISGLTAGTYTFKAVNTNAESSTITVTVTEPTPVHNYAITLTGDSIIETGDSATVIATLTDNNVAVIGETLSYEIKHGQTTIDTGTDTTDSNGQISISYTGSGVGDVDIVVSYGTLLQETFVVQDLYLYDTLTSDNGLFSVRTGSASLQYSSNGLSYLGTRTTDTYTYLNSQLPTNYEIECTITGLTYDSPYGQFCADIRLNNTGISCSTVPNWIGLTWGNITEGGAYSDKDTSKRLQIGDVIRFKRENGSISIYLNGTLMGTYTETNTDGFCLKTYDTRGITIKDLKIKAL